jgi:tetratricopeptide (TPR) repeat protein
MIYEKVRGPDHPDTAISLNNLAGVLIEQGDYAAAHMLCRRAMMICEKARPDHPDTALILHNFAGVLRELGDYDAARSLFERALTIWEKALGADHPYTAFGVNSAGLLCLVEKNYADAATLFERALAIRVTTLGPNHPHTAICFNNFGGLLRELGDYAAARPLLESALTVRENALGPDHPYTAITRHLLLSLPSILTPKTSKKSFKSHIAVRGDNVEYVDFRSKTKPKQNVAESNKPPHTVHIMESKAAELAALAKAGNYSINDLKQAIVILEAEAQAEITTRGKRPANAGPRAVTTYLTAGNAALAVLTDTVSDWIEARKGGITLPDFIRERFAPELATGQMHRGLLSRYDELQGDFYSLGRSKQFPEWLKGIPKKSDWIKRQVAAGKVNPTPTDEMRAYHRDAMRVLRATKPKSADM